MTIAEAVNYLRAAEANEGADFIPESDFVLLEDLELVGWDADQDCHVLRDNGRQWLKQLTKE
jgi:hypothetical protein